MPLIEIPSEAVKPVPTTAEKQKAFVDSLKMGLLQEALRRKQFLEQAMAGIWGDGVQRVQDPDTKQITSYQAGLTVEEKIDALNEAGISVDLFMASSEDIEHLLKYSKGIVVNMPPNKDNYNIAIADGKVSVTHV